MASSSSSSSLSSSSFFMLQSPPPHKRFQNRGSAPKHLPITLHPLSNLSNTWPLLLVSNIKLTFTHGKGKSGMKFHNLRELMINSLPTAPSPGPATFVVRCLDALLLIEPPYGEGISHLLTSALSHMNPVDRSSEDAAIARKLAASILYNAVIGRIILEARIIIRLVEVFSIQLKDVQEAMNIHSRGEGHAIRDAEEFIQYFMLNLIKARSYNSAAALWKHFDIQAFTSQEFLVSMILDGQPDLAGHWAAYVGKGMISFLVRHCTEMGMFKMAYKFVQSYGLHEEFPDACYLYKRSLLHKLARKGLWHVAEKIAEEDHYLSEYLVTLACEEGRVIKDANICGHVQYKNFTFHDGDLQKNDGNEGPFLELRNIISEDRVIWVDSSEGLAFAENHLTNASVIGIDCEWKANRLNEKRPVKVSILQLATSKFVFIFDLILLSEQESRKLDRCIQSVFLSKNILKLGYAVHNDLKGLLRSYQDLECFYICESVLDIQKVSGRVAKGGLSGLVKVVLGCYLDKQTQMSNWEERPLSIRQLHYAALDAFVLLSIFDHICSGAMPTFSDAVGDLSDWKDHVTSFRFMRISKVEVTTVDTPLQKSHYSRDLMKARWPEKYLEDFHYSEGDMKGSIICTTITCCASYDDLVFASCELVGLPTPGLLKDELLNITRAARLPPPIYKTFSLGAEDSTGLFAIVKVSDHEFCGRPACTKKEAILWAAVSALSVIRM